MFCNEKILEEAFKDAASRSYGYLLNEFMSKDRKVVHVGKKKLRKSRKRFTLVKLLRKDERNL